MGTSIKFDFKKASKNSKIALCGGAFDPFHRGHEVLGCKVKEFLEVDYVVYLPSFYSPWKADQTSPFQKRYDLIKAHLHAVCSDPSVSDLVASSLKVSDFEKNLSPPSYTAKTLDALEELSFDLKNFWWICGHDVWEGVPSWYEFTSVLERINFLVTYRSAASSEPSQWAHRHYDFRDGEGLHKKTGSVVRFCDFKIPGWSSSQSRKDLMDDPKHCPEALRKEVYQKIVDEQLYGVGTA